ncbi:MAG: hypothetical protein QG641_951 [Candidatus Poribacteria bacterium]|nr:hypothetical protein [Candidatus Poribacteria bacterium]
MKKDDNIRLKNMLDTGYYLTFSALYLVFLVLW